jgi:hypothetical protein
MISERDMEDVLSIHVEKFFGEYRTRRLMFEAWDRLKRGDRG